MITIDDIVNFVNNEIRKNIKDKDISKGLLLDINDASLITEYTVTQSVLNNEKQVAFMKEVLADFSTLGPSSKYFATSTSGICHNLSHAFSLSPDCDVLGRRLNSYELVDILSRGWPKHSGRTSFPIPYENYNKSPFMRSDTFWSGAAYKKRKELCIYLVDVIQRLTEKYNVGE